MISSLLSILARVDNPWDHLALLLPPSHEGHVADRIHFASIQLVFLVPQLPEILGLDSVVIGISKFLKQIYVTVLKSQSCLSDVEFGSACELHNPSVLGISNNNMDVLSAHLAELDSLFEEASLALTEGYVSLLLVRNQRHLVDFSFSHLFPNLL